MLRGVAWASLAIAAVALPAPAWANSYAFPIDIRSKPLAAALQELARQTGIELLYDRQLLRGLRAPAVRGRMTIDAALARLLEGSDLVARRGSSGAWLIARRPVTPAAAVPEEVVGPEILVTGQLTQNVDIRRRENDVQPYRVDTRETIVRAHRDDIDQYFRSRVTANTQVVPPSLTEGGHTNSAIDLRGLGVDNTLVLVDGRRLPGDPGSRLVFGQPDLNAIPLRAIERIETLTGTAGGVHGFGALGGVTNIVLRRDYRGLELHATSGISSRGDARRASIEAGFGFTPDGGDTEVALYVSHSWSEALFEGQRDFKQRARRNIDRLAPEALPHALPYPVGQSVGVFLFIDPYDTGLIFKPGYGGAALGTDHTYLPSGFAGSPADLVASLTAHAGKIDLSTADNERRTQMGSNPDTTSAIFNIRHRFGGGVEAYFDALILRNRGHWIGHESSGDLVLFPEDPQNPFDNYVWLTFPALPEEGHGRISHDSERFTGGVIVPLPFGWRGTAEASFGGSHYISDSGARGYYSGPLFLDGSESPAFNPFGNWDAFQQSLEAYLYNARLTFRARNRYRAQSLRLTGPLFRTAAGPATATIALENNREAVRGYSQTWTADIFDPVTSTSLVDAHARRTRSLYAEVRIPVTAEAARIPLLKGLELQLSARRDDQDVDFTQFFTEARDEHRATFAGTGYTVGAKFSPLPWLMLRGSYAKGYQPPELGNLLSLETTNYYSTTSDPRRGDRWIGDDGPYQSLSEGSPDLKAVRAMTLSVGAVFNPLGDHGPRFSLDYSRIRRTGDFQRLTDALVLEHEAMWPERVTREPLSDADRAAGFSAGRVTAIDARGINAGRVRVETLDARLDWTVPFAAGKLHSYGSATWQMRNRTSGPFSIAEERAGYLNGPLRWRVNGGAEWSIGRSMIGANLQYFSRYRIIEQRYAGVADLVEVPQGSKWVDTQLYFDLYASHRFALPWAGKDREITLDLGVVNLFDRAPSYQVNSSFLTQQVSFYGDPRRRRFELTLSAGF